MQGLLSILSLLRNDFNKFNNTGARMLDWIFHRKLKLFTNIIFGKKTLRFCHLLLTVVIDALLHNLQTTNGLSIYFMAVYHLKMRRHVIKFFMCARRLSFVKTD